MPSLPIWSEVRLPAYPRFPGGTLRADVAIVGAGLTGLSAAYHILVRQPGRRVIVLEAEQIGAGASGRSTGMLGPGVGQSLMTLVRRFGPVRAQALYRASLQAIADVCSLSAAERIECELQMTGQLIVAHSQAGRYRLATQAALLEQFNCPVERLDNAALNTSLRFAPALVGSDRLQGPAALRLPVAGILHPMRLLSGLADAATRRGAAIFEKARVLAVGYGEPVRLALHGGEVIADSVVLATAGYTPDLGLLRGRLLPVHLQAVVTEPMSEPALRSIGWQGREGVLDARRIFSYFRLTQDNRIVFGGGAPRYRWADSTAQESHSPVRLERLAVELARTFPAEAKLRVAAGWTGVIDYMLDALPAIGRLRSRPSVLHVVGWCGHGVALAVASGSWVSQMLCDGRAREDLPWYRDNAPLLPGKLVRWLGFRAAVRVKSCLDFWNE